MVRVNKISRMEADDTEVELLSISGSVGVLFGTVVEGCVVAGGFVAMVSVMSVGSVTSRLLSLGNKLQPNVALNIS